jgi:hypothetical protein
MIDRVDALEARMKQLEAALEIERKINQAQTETLARRQQALIRHERQTRRGLEVLAAALLGFLGFSLVVLSGLRLEFGWGTFALPANLFESGALVAGATAAAKYFLDRQRESTETPPQPASKQAAE